MKEDIKKSYEEQKNMNYQQRNQYRYERLNNKIEQRVLKFIQHNNLHQFIAGDAGSRFEDESDLSYTNAGVVLNAIYRVYEKYPELKVDDKFEDSLIKLLDGGRVDFYIALNTIYVQLDNEEKGVSPFMIDNPEVYKELKSSIIKNMDYLNNSRDYRGRLYDNNLFGFVEDIDKTVENQKGIKIL